jgi:murein DD-endopeptidase MepM/ murein hydrolase activator NlpD
MTRPRGRARRLTPIAIAFCSGAVLMLFVGWTLWGARVQALSDDCGNPGVDAQPTDAVEPERTLPPVIGSAARAREVAPAVDLAGAVPELRARNLIVPVRGIAAADLVGSFDDARSGGRRHEAMDILAPRHTPVLAVEDGTIARLFESKAGGLTIYQFDPSATYTYYYAHLERYAAGVTAGDRVRRGQVIGYVGTTGNAPPDTPHLHFGIFRLTDAKRWWDGAPIDPFRVWRAN